MAEDEVRPDNFREPFVNDIPEELNNQEGEFNEANDIFHPDYYNEAGIGDNNASFLDKLTSKEITDLFNDILPSIFFIALIILPFYFSNNYCDSNMYLVMKTLFFIYVGFLLRAIIRSIFVCINQHDKPFYKTFLSIIDLVISLSYYICVFLSYMVYSASSVACFRSDTLTVMVYFSLVFAGLITFVQKIINFILLMICFILMVNSFTSDPSSFYIHYGVDPEIIKNLPTIPADKKHLGTCVICLKDISEGDEILIVNCPGKHYFHGDCIKSWLLVKSSCPMCRSNII